MTSSSDIATKFEAAIKAFTPIVGQPKDNDLQGLRKVLLQTCLSICLVGSKAGKVTSLVLPNAAYKNRPRVTISFDEDDTPLEKYDPSFTRETEAWEQQKSPGALEHPPRQSRPHPNHKAQMPYFHPARLRGSTLHIPPRRRHLQQNGVYT